MQRFLTAAVATPLVLLALFYLPGWWFFAFIAVLVDLAAYEYLVIRTSGELRVSNFLLWQIAYAEFYVTETLWPDFSPQEFILALESFGSRSRRRGGV